MNKKEFNQELEKHDLDVCSFLDLRDAWYHLRAEEKLELLEEEKHD